MAKWKVSNAICDLITTPPREGRKGRFIYRADFGMQKLHKNECSCMPMMKRFAVMRRG